MGTQIAASCNAEDQKKALTFANSICQQNGVTVPSDGLAVSSAAAAAEAPAATEAASGSGGEEAKEVPSASETVAADATETGAAETTSGEPPVSCPFPAIACGMVTDVAGSTRYLPVTEPIRQAAATLLPPSRRLRVLGLDLVLRFKACCWD